MADFGYTLLCEQAGPRQLIADAVQAERAGFDFAVISDHFNPWLESQGHAPFAWSVQPGRLRSMPTPKVPFTSCGRPTPFPRGGRVPADAGGPASPRRQAAESLRPHSQERSSGPPG